MFIIIYFTLVFLPKFYGFFSSPVLSILCFKGAKSGVIKYIVILIYLPYSSPIVSYIHHLSLIGQDHLTHIQRPSSLPPPFSLPQPPPPWIAISSVSLSHRSPLSHVSYIPHYSLISHDCLTQIQRPSLLPPPFSLPQPPLPRGSWSPLCLSPIANRTPSLISLSHQVFPLLLSIPPSISTYALVFASPLIRAVATPKSVAPLSFVPPWSALLDHYRCGHRRLPLRSPRHHHNSVGQPRQFPPRRWRRIVAIAMPHWSPPTTRCHCRLLCLKRHRRRSVLTPPPTVHHRHPQIAVEKTLTSSQAPAPPFSIEGHVQVHLPFFLSRSAPSPLPRPDFFRVEDSGPVLALCRCWRSLQTNFNHQYS